MTTFRIEVKYGQPQRMVEADTFCEVDGWLIFYRKPPTGGTQEYWRVRLEGILAMETVSSQ